MTSSSARNGFFATDKKAARSYVENKQYREAAILDKERRLGLENIKKSSLKPLRLPELAR